jgi:dTDP-glucose 4,6-dehydratase
MNILITGGAGFIGSNYCRIMTEQYPDDRFVCLDALTYAGNKKNLSLVEKKPNFCFVLGNICDKDFVLGLFEKEHFDLVVNFAAETDVDASIQSPSLFLNTNLIGTGVLLEAAVKYGVKRFHQVSTDEVYGDLPLNEKNCQFDESSQLRPSNPYSASKAAADLLVLSYHRTYGLPVSISRCTNNFGPYQNSEKFIPKIIERASENKKVPIFGDGNNIRDWIFVDDHCRAVDLIARHGTNGEIYNIAGHNEMANIELAKMIIAALGKPESLLEFVSDRPGHDARYSLKSSKIVNEFHWEPSVSFRIGLEKTIKWYQDNKDWIKE